MKFETIGNNKKRVGITLGIVGIILVIGVTAFTLTRASYKQTQSVPLIKGNISYSNSDLDVIAIKLKDIDNYTDSDIVPTSGYTLNEYETICKDKSGNKINTEFTYANGIVNVSVTKKGTKCTLVFDKIYPSISLISTLLSNGELIQENGYRYENTHEINGEFHNFVTFNNELWKIIGVFDVKKYNGSTEQLVKIIRAQAIGYLMWDSNGSNDWTQSDLKNILNGQYYNGEDINYTYRNASKGTVSIKDKSISKTARNMIEEVHWYLGGANSDSVTADQMYNAEKTSTTWIGKVGLMYASDLGYSGSNTICSRAATLKNIDSDCYDYYWLREDSNWFITKNTSNANIVFAENGTVTSKTVTGLEDVRPVVYLKSNVSILNNGKDGSQSKPYDLVLN